MNRRDFVTDMGTMTLAGIIATIAPKVIQGMPQDKLFKGAAGQILESTDGGKVWQINADFGPEHSILDVFSGGRYTYVEVQFQGYSFFLRSPDGAKWWTV